jgi:hypothetical protein
MAMKREPIFWLTTSDPRNGAAERERIIMVDSEQLIEKHPQHGHSGDYENRTKAPGVRYIKVVRHEGHTVAMVLTNGAAHLDPTGPYGNHVRSKARFLGWYPEGACPVALLNAGELGKRHIACAENLSPKAKACAPKTSNQANPCEHDLTERAARTAKWNKKQFERLAGFRSEAERYAEAVAKSNKELVVDVANAVAAKVAAAAQPPAEARQPSK